MGKLHSSAWWLAALSGALQILIFPIPNLYWLCWFAYAPLLVAVLRARDSETLNIPETLGHTRLPASLGQAFLLGWLAGIMWSAGTCYWIYHVMHVYGGLNAIVSLGILVLFCLYIGLHTALFAMLLALVAKCGNIRVSTRRALVAAPFLWVAVEFVRTVITGFPWDVVGTAQVDNIPLTRLATVTGVYGLSFEILLVNTAFAAALLARRGGRKLLAAAAIVATVTLQLSILVQPPPMPADRTARLVQQNIPILEGWPPEYFQHTMSELRQKSMPPGPGETDGEPPADLVIWPESPAPFYLNDPLFRTMVSQIASQAHAYVIVGTLGVENQARGQVRPQELFNSAALIAPDGTWVARYDKVHLVPFGEFVPFKAVLGFAHQLTSEVGDFVPGSKRTVFDFGTYKIGTFICYESTFPGEVRQFAANGGQVFVNISNDEWFGHSAAPEQHLNQARMRAIENGRWLLRATNTGITASIDPFGRVVDRAPRDVMTTLDAPYGVVASTTFYTRHGDWFCWLCVIISILVIVGSIPRVYHATFARVRLEHESPRK